MSRLVSARLRGLPRPVWILVTGSLITRAGSFVIPFLSVYLIRERGLSSVFAGLALSAYGAGGMLASLIGGQLTDKLGRKTVLVGSPLLAGAATLVLYFGQAPAVVVGMSFLAGLVTEATRPAVVAMLTDLTPPERRIDVFALWRLVINLGFTIGLTLGGLLVRYGFGKLFIADAATTWTYGAIAFFLLVETKPDLGETEEVLGMRAGFRLVASDPVFRRVWLGAFFTACVYSQPMTTLAITLTKRGMSAASFGFLIALNGAIIIVAEFWVSGRTRRYPPPRVLALGALLTGYGYALTGGAGHSIPLLVWSVLVWTLGEMVHAPTSNAYVSSLAPAHLRGRYAGAYGLSWSIAFTLGPVLGGLAMDHDERYLWYGVLLLGLVASAVYSTLPPDPATRGAVPGRLLSRPRRRAGRAPEPQPVYSAQLPG